MQPIRVRVTRVIDHGTVVSVVGIDAESNEPVVVHVDHRPFQAIWDGWQAEGFPQPITFDAERLTLSLGIEPDEQPEPAAAPAA